MKKTISLTLLWTLLALIGTGAAIARDVAEEPFEETVSVASDGRVTLSNTNGSVRVETWNRDEVHISAVKRAGLTSLSEGQRVQFELVTNDRCKTSAENISPLD